MAPITCNASYKKNGNKTVICNRNARFLTTNGTGCCGYHKKYLFVTSVDESTKEVERECSICLTVCENNDEHYTTPCNHLFHEKCMEKWANASKKLTCPLCRTEIKEHAFECKQADTNFSIADAFLRISNENDLSSRERVILRDRLLHLFHSGNNAIEVASELLESAGIPQPTESLTRQNLAFNTLLREILAFSVGIII